ncbi:hypothetical protein EV06_0938 [Prochlorococcus sp. MIT 0602]|nr:hypothetical protein EV06_0938 [Prochlorococcus sp. MIT 0602]KGG17346.1 hypothetical protein EV07_0784 [Prochlorococcus sp. MIT 0603]
MEKARDVNASPFSHRGMINSLCLSEARMAAASLFGLESRISVIDSPGSLFL